jgi:hypothetical protein
LRASAGPAATLLGVLLGAALGSALALAAIPAHRHVLTVAGLALPSGLVIAVGAALCCGWALRGTGLTTVGVGIGWLAVLIGALPGGPGGDYVYLTDVAGWGLLIGGVGAGLVLLVTGLGGRETH